MFSSVREIQLPGNVDEAVSVRRMQPAAAEIEGDVGRGENGVRPAAEPVAGFEHDDREPGIFQRPRRAEAGGAGADDGDVD